MKTIGTVIIGLIGAGLVAFFVFGYWMYGGEAEKEKAAIHVAMTLGPGRLVKLVKDCKALVREGKATLPPGEPQWWSDATKCPKEFRDIRPIKAYIGEDFVWLVTYQCLDEDVTIEVTGLRSETPKVTVRYGDYQNYKDAILWDKKPDQTTESTGAGNIAPRD